MDHKALTKGPLLLEQWAKLCVSTVANPQFEFGKTGDSVICKVFLPTKHTLQVEASNVELAAAQMIAAVQNAILLPLIKDHLSEMASADSVIGGSMVTNFIASTTTKSRRDTIGVSTSKALKLYIRDIAVDLGISEARLARDLVTQGFEELEERMYSENPLSLLADYQSDLEMLQSEETDQWMIRVDRHVFIRIKMTAKNYGKSFSQIAAGCLAHALHMQPLTNRQREQVREIVGRYKGPKMRVLAKEVGIDEKFAPLLSGVIVGRTIAPPKLLKRLSHFLNTPSYVLAEGFRHSFESTCVPSYKSEGKPNLSVQPISWEDAVNALDTSRAEIENLLKFL